MVIVHRVQMGIGDKVVIIHAAMAATTKHANKKMASVINANMDTGETVASYCVIQVAILPVDRQLVIVFAEMDTMGIGV